MTNIINSLNDLIKAADDTLALLDSRNSDTDFDADGELCDVHASLFLAVYHAKQAMVDSARSAETKSEVGVTSPANTSEVSEVDKRRAMAAQIVEWSGKEVNGVTVGKVMEFLREYPSPNNPLPVSLEKCIQALKQSDREYDVESCFVMSDEEAKAHCIALLESLKAQGARFDYVD